MGRKLKTERNFRKSDPPYFPKENKAYKMKIVVVLLVVSLAAARHPHHRQDAAWTSWTKIGKSYFKVFGTLAETDWDTAENDCESFSGKIRLSLRVNLSLAMVIWRMTQT